MRARPLAAAAVAAVLLLSGCGGSDATSDQTSDQTTSGEAGTASPSPSTTTEEAPPSASQLFTDMKAAATAATSGRVAGSIVQSGEPMTIDLRGNRDGSNQIVTMSLSGANATLISVDGTEYVKGDRAFWTERGMGQVADTIGDKYMSRPGNSFSGGINLGTLLDDMFSEEFTTLDNLNTNVERADVNGAPAFKLTQRAGNDDTEVWVAAEGEPHLLRITGTYENAPLNLEFSDWNAVQPATAPPADQVIST